jgi:hypothetical protein
VSRTRFKGEIGLRNDGPSVLVLFRTCFVAIGGLRLKELLASAPPLRSHPAAIHWKRVRATTDHPARRTGVARRPCTQRATEEWASVHSVRTQLPTARITLARAIANRHRQQASRQTSMLSACSFHWAETQSIFQFARMTILGADGLPRSTDDEILTRCTGRVAFVARSALNQQGGAS